MDKELMGDLCPGYCPCKLKTLTKTWTKSRFYVFSLHRAIYRMDRQTVINQHSYATRDTFAEVLLHHQQSIRKQNTTNTPFSRVI